MWLLPPVFLVWANCHAGFFMGWLVFAAYCGEALIQRLRKKPLPDERRLWLVAATCFAHSFTACTPRPFTPSSVRNRATGPNWRLR